MDHIVIKMLHNPVMQHFTTYNLCVYRGSVVTPSHKERNHLVCHSGSLWEEAKMGMTLFKPDGYNQSRID